MTRLGQDTGARLVAAFDFLAVLVGRDWVTTREIADALGCHPRTVRRYALGSVCDSDWSHLQTYYTHWSPLPRVREPGKEG